MKCNNAHQTTVYGSKCIAFHLRLSLLSGRRRQDCEGSIMFLVMAFIGALVVLGTTASIINKTDIGIVDRSQRTMGAFYNTEAGIDYYRDKINAALVARTLKLEQPVETLGVLDPAYAGYSFGGVTTLEQQANPRVYLMRVTGTSRDAETTIDVTLRRKRLINFGIFANRSLQMQPGGNMYSYNSRFAPNPTPALSDGRVYAASNEDVTVSSPGHIDGEVFMGEDSVGNPGIYSGPATTPSHQIDRIDPDPLGMNGGDLATDYLYYSSSANNDNASAPSLISGTTLRVSGGPKTISTGNYYLTNFDLGANKRITVDASAGPVNIYLNGNFRMQPNSEITVIGQPYDFRILSKSTDRIELQPNSSFKGFVYAPNAEIQIQPNGNVYGAFWAKDVRMAPDQDVYIDMDAMDAILEKRVQILSWKESRRD